VSCRFRINTNGSAPLPVTQCIWYMMATPSSFPREWASPALLTALSEQRRDFRDVSVAQILPLRKFDYFDFETHHHVRHTAYFYGGASRPGGWTVT
jgi:hypothetical protein